MTQAGAAPGRATTRSGFKIFPMNAPSCIESSVQRNFRRVKRAFVEPNAREKRIARIRWKPRAKSW
ncbi:hypothetical protein [Burkholderia guangdongensis]|uniref:hypothetical protein n=1 Tax=Burkholderia guangdongensis TaxID=1792500 RepID=UPI0015CA9FEF|nr:hypothetical protein [Burkholderia guangdongensis]